jgi:general secretion pathway protein K
VPCRSANKPLAELGELTLVKGFDERSIERLRPFVSVLPLSLPINVNFASAEVLAAVIPEMKLSDARVLVRERHSRPFKDMNDFTQRAQNGVNNMNNNDLSVRSSFFWVTGRAKVGRAQITTQALLQRTGGWPMVVWQSVQ